MFEYRRLQRGFTLIELMIVVVVIALLAAVAYPAYTEQVRKSRRADAIAGLLELANFMERQYTTNNRYQKFDDDTNAWVTMVTADLPFDESPRDGSTTYYNLAISGNTTATTYTLTATPQNAQTSDTKCGILSLNQQGVRGVLNGTVLSTGDAAAKALVTDCWGR